MENKLNILHLTDLHWGWPSADYNFRNRYDDFQKDIKTIMELQPLSDTGEIDLVVFTGDLTYSGTKEQFNDLSQFLNDIWGFFKNDLNSEPYLACIPGNHDLQRPIDGFIEITANYCKSNYFDQDEVYKKFWENFPSNPYGQMIQECFKDYTDWYDRLLSSQNDNVALKVIEPSQTGIMPGDFSTTFEKNGISVGLVGLNSAFLHLGDSAFGNLEINPKQLFAVCGDDVPKWLSDVDFSFLLSHHGPEWYHIKAKMRYNEEIYKPHRFSSHIFGHVHDAKTEISSISGASEQRLQVGKALYGMEKYKNHKSGQEVIRSHGYSIIQLAKDDDHIKIKLFPRATSSKRSWNYTRDSDFKLNEKDGSQTLLKEPVLKRKPDVAPSEDKVSVAGSEVKTSATGSKSKRISKESPPNDYSDVYAIRKKVLQNPKYIEILKDIEAHVTNRWEEHSGLDWEPMHGPNHNRQVEKALYKLIPESKYDKLDPEDWFILLVSVWLHEIGMIIGLFGKEDKKDKKEAEDYARTVRDNHHERSVRYIRENHKKLNITRYKNAIEFCCQNHRKTETIKRPEKELPDEINIQLLVAYLRLALATHLDVGVNDDNLFDLMHTPNLSWEDRFHWQKQKWIKDIIINFENYLITVKAYVPPENSSLHEIFPDKLIEDMKEGLLVIRDILARGEISFFYDVEHKPSGEILNEAYINQMQLIRSNIDLEEISSASQAYNTVLDTFDRFTSGDLENSAEIVTSYFRNIEKVLKSRPCHTLIRNLRSELSDYIKKINIAPQENLNNIRTLILKKKKGRENLISKIKDNSRPFLLDKKSILVYGYSSMVIYALESIPEDIREKTEIYIAECRGKTQFNIVDQMIYNDGLQYVKKCKKMMFKKIYFIPDISVANLMKRGFIGKVLFGANGIDKISGNFGHTCGHLMVADLACIYNVPLYVILDSSKIGELEYDDETNRDINWLPKIKGYPKEHDGDADPSQQTDRNESVMELLNPREDSVGSDRITMIITENGVQHPKKHNHFGQILLVQHAENPSQPNGMRQNRASDETHCK